MGTNPRPDRTAVPDSTRVTAMALLLGAVMLALPADAQQRLYRVIGPNGEVTYTDRPPLVATPARVEQPRLASGPPTASLPADLVQVVNRFPVTLYTGPSCAEPCADARALLRQRGVPHLERTVSTERDIAEISRLAGSATLPSLMIGRQPLVGLRQAEWIGYLDAAGYPATSRLPANYSFAAAAPLTRPVAEPAAVERPAARAVPEPTPGPGAGGIRF